MMRVKTMRKLLKKIKNIEKETYGRNTTYYAIKRIQK